MEIIDAYWDTRNLGVPCIEYILDPKDSLDELTKSISSRNATYEVLKIPAGRADALLLAQKKGFNCIELITQIKFPTKLFNETSLYKRIKQKIKCRDLNPEEIYLAEEQIYNGAFKTDRIALDPNFGATFSRQRYVGWLYDEIKKGSTTVGLFLENLLVGFFIASNKADWMTLPLGGITSTQHQKAFGAMLLDFQLEYAIKAKSKGIIVSYSSNNIGATALHLAKGGILIAQYYILIRNNLPDIS